MQTTNYYLINHGANQICQVLTRSTRLNSIITKIWNKTGKQNSKFKTQGTFIEVFHEILNSPQNSKQETNLDDADFVGHIQSVIVWSQPHICLLSSIRPEQETQKSSLA